MKQDKSQKQPTRDSRGFPPLQPTPGMTAEEQQAALDKLRKELPQWMADNLNRNVKAGLLTS